MAATELMRAHGVDEAATIAMVGYILVAYLLLRFALFLKLPNLPPSQVHDAIRIVDHVLIELGLLTNPTLEVCHLPLTVRSSMIPHGIIALCMVSDGIAHIHHVA